MLTDFQLTYVCALCWPSPCNPTIYACVQRCTPEQWAALLALYRAQPLPSSSAGNSSTEVKPGRHIPTRWLTAYTLMLEQYGCQPSRVEGVAGAVTGAAHAAPSTAAQQANGVPSLTCEVEGAADLGIPGAAAGQSVARLPDGLLQQGLLLQQQLLERHRPAQAVRRQTMYPATLEVCISQDWKWRVVWLYWAVQVIADGQVTGQSACGALVSAQAV
mgnify:CR=1 FL=1